MQDTLVAELQSRDGRVETSCMGGVVRSMASSCHARDVTALVYSFFFVKSEWVMLVK